MITKELIYFDISQICDSGQCFRMEKKDNDRYQIIAGEKYLEITQEGINCTFCYEQEEFDTFWAEYFDLSTDYENYISQIDPEDAYLSSAASLGGGIRILKQDLWEMMVSFLISQRNSITNIRRCIRNISERYGKELRTSTGEIYYAFPEPQALAGLEEDKLQECKLGYRSKYVVRAAKSIVSGEISLEAIRQMSYEEARTELLKIYGVGKKVADCICLFALHHLEAFPIDTHIHQVLDKYYQQGFPFERYQGFQGVVQAYIFYYKLFGEKIIINPNTSPV